MDSAFLLQASSIINIIGLVQSVTLAVTLFLSKRTSKINYLIASMSLVLALVIGNTLLILNGTEGESSLLQPLSNAAASLIGPIIWLITTLSLGDKRPIAQHWPHAIPFLLFLPMGLVLEGLLSGSDQARSVSMTVNSILLWLWNVQILIYLFSSFMKLRALKFKPKSDGYWLKWMVRLFLIICVINFILTLINRFLSPLPKGLTLNITVLLSLVVAAIVIKSQKSPINKVALPNSDQASSMDAITQLISTEELYKQQDLNLASLAEKAELSARELSAIINDQLGKNFNEFVNEFRVKEVIRKINEKAHEQMTILGLAREAGFKSNSAFYRAFKNHTGFTPTEFIKQKG